MAVRTIPIYIALGGSAGVGKTVFANVASSRLSEGNSKTLSFVPETRTAQHVYRTISGLRRGEWPPRTGTDQIERYRGTVEFTYQSIRRRFIDGRIEFSLEIGDSAGELWDELGGDDSLPSKRLIDSTFFEYVGESTALLYFIDSATLKNDPRNVGDHVDDLLSALQVLRSIEGRGAQQINKPIAVIISKADLLSGEELDALRSVFSGSSADRRSFPFIDGTFLASIERLRSSHDGDAETSTIFYWLYCVVIGGKHG